MSSIQGYLRQQKQQATGLISLATGLGTLAGVLLILQAWCLATVVNAVIFEHASLEPVMPWLWAMLVLLLLRALLAYTSEQVAFAAAVRIKHSVRQKIYTRLEALGPQYLSEERSGELATTVVDGVEALEAYYARFLPAMSLAALVPLAVLAFVFPLDWQSATIFLFTAPLIPFFMILIGKGAEALNQKQWKQLQRMGGHFLDVIQGLTTLKLFNASRREADIIARISEDYRLSTMKVLRVAFLSSLVLEFFATVSIAVVAVLIGFRLLFAELDFLTGFFILLLAPEFYLPLRSLGTHYHARMNAIGSAERIVEILQQPLPEQMLTESALQVEKPVSIQLRNVSFAYTPDVPVLVHLDFNIDTNERIALVGPTGSGKSTLVKLLLGFVHPLDGTILINGVGLAKIERSHWYRQLAWVPQQPRLFHGTIAENISLGLPDSSQQSIVDAATQANAMEFIEDLPEGLMTVVGEGGRILSGGQIQRIVIARAFLRDAAVVIFDEATANLDAESERLVHDAITRLTKGRTVLMIAHRLATVRDADRILVLQGGRIVQQGHHEELSQQPGLYRQLLADHGAVA